MIHFTWIHLAALVPPLLLIEGFFSGSEIALLSADKLQLKRLAQSGSTGAALALDLAKHPERVLSTTLLMTSGCVVAISALLGIYFLENYPTIAEWLPILFTSLLVVLIGELIPKAVYQKNANRIAPYVAYPLQITYIIFFPLTRILSIYTNRLSRLVIPIEELISGKRKTTRDQILNILQYTKKESEIRSSEKNLIKRIIDFKDIEAKHALIPLVRVEAIEETATVHEALGAFERHRHSRMPVFSERVDNIVGVLEVTDLMNATNLEETIHFYLKPAYYVADTQSLEDLVLEMREDERELVVVVDEHGGAVGILTFEDIVEEIVGEISDEYDYDEPHFKVISDYSWVIQANMKIQHINDELKFEIPEGDYETLSGFLLQQFGRIPGIRDELIFDTRAGSFRFIVQRATERHIERVIVKKLNQEN